MTKHADDRRLMRMLAVILTVVWAVTAVIIATAYRPGGPVDVLVALACFVPVAIADLGVIRPARTRTRPHRIALVWVWIMAVIFLLPVMYGIAGTITPDGPQGLLPSAEAAYGGAIALFAMSYFSVVGLVHQRLRRRPLERHASLVSAAAAAGLTLVAGVAFVFVAVANERDLRTEAEASAGSPFGPTDPELVPPHCDEPVALGADAQITITAKSRVDTVDRGTAVLEGRRSGGDESWGGSWSGPDGSGQQAYLRVGPQAWINDQDDDPRAPGTSWTTAPPNPFELLGTTALTMDGPPHSVALAPRGAIVAEDLGLERVQSARARHCRTFIDGSTALDTFLPLRWLLANSSEHREGALSTWRGELDWWVFGDGELGLAAAEVSGARIDTGWDSDGVRVVLEAQLEAVHRDQPVDLSVSAPSASDSGSALESDAP